MIIRQALIRHGRRMVPTNHRMYARSLATAHSDTLEQALEHSVREVQSIASQLRDATEDPPAQVYQTLQATIGGFDEAPVEAAQAKKHQDLHVGRLGTNVEAGYVPNSLVVNPPSPSEVTLPLLLAAQAHLGHSTSLWNPMNSRYIFGIRQGIHVISLEATAAHLRRACRVVSGVAERGGLILFVGTRKGQETAVIGAARRSGGCYLFDRWLPGSITNGMQILGTSKVKAVDPFDRPIEGFDDELDDEPPLKPDLVVCLNPLENYVLLRECGQHQIPTIGIIDTDANPTWVTYPIPANDDSVRCAQLVCGALGMAAKEGRDARLRKAVAGELTYTPRDMEKSRLT